MKIVWAPGSTLHLEDFRELGNCILKAVVEREKTTNPAEAFRLVAKSGGFPFTDKVFYAGQIERIKHRKVFGFIPFFAPLGQVLVELQGEIFESTGKGNLYSEVYEESVRETVNQELKKFAESTKAAGVGAAR